MADDATDPQYTISGSTVLAAIRTAGSLIVFASGFFATVAKFLSAHDLAGLYNYLQQNSTVAGLATAATFGWLVWRTAVAWLKKRRDVAVYNAAPNATVKQGVLP